MQATPLCEDSYREIRFHPYVKLDEVIAALEESSVRIDKITFHNMPSNVQFLKQLDEETALSIIPDISEAEVRLATLLPNSNPAKGKLFPSIAICGTKLSQVFS